MNKNILIGIGGVILAGIGYSIWKKLDKKEKEADADFQETIKKVNEENPDWNIESDNNNFLDKIMEEQKAAEEATKNWDDRNENIKKESQKKSLDEQDIFKDNVADSKELSAINAIREAAGKEPIKMNEDLEKFLGTDSESKSMKESLDNIAEMANKNPELKKTILNALKE